MIYDLTQPWMIEPDRAEELIVSAVEKKELLSGLSDRQTFRLLGCNEGEGGDSLVTRIGDVRIISVRGTMVGYKPSASMASMFNLVCTDEITERVESLGQNAEVSRIIMEFDSPGGEATGIAELANAVAACEVPTVAYVRGLCASAAYHVAVACDEIATAPNAFTGSVGAVLQFARCKGASNFERLEIISSQTPRKRLLGKVFDEDDEVRAAAREEAQKIVDDVAGVFIATVTSYRKGIKKEGMDGRMVMGRESVEMGLTDRVAFLRDEIAGTRASNRRNKELQMSGKDEGAGNGTAKNTDDPLAAERQRQSDINALEGPDDIKLAAITGGLSLDAAKTMLGAVARRDEANAEAAKNSAGAAHLKAREDHEAGTPLPDAGAGDTSDTKGGTHAQEIKEAAACVKLHEEMNPLVAATKVASANRAVLN